jgi:hypothetical protein
MADPTCEGEWKYYPLYGNPQRGRFVCSCPHQDRTTGRCTKNNLDIRQLNLAEAGHTYDGSLALDGKISRDLALHRRCIVLQQRQKQP